MKNPLKTLLVGLILLISSLSLYSQCLNFSFEESVDGSDLLIDMRVENFTDILAIQMAFGYPSENLQLIAVTSDAPLAIFPSNFNLNNPGYIAFVWNAAIGNSIADGTSLLQFRFQQLNSNPSAIIILDQNPLKVEIVNDSFEELCYTSNSIIINDPRAKIIGNITHDIDGTCLESVDDLPLEGWKVKISSDSETYYRLTNKSGRYILPVDLGEYTIEVLPINDLWSPCIASQTIIVDTEGTVYSVSFVMSPVEESSALSVGMKAQRLRRCFDNDYQVVYRNDGTVASTNTIIEIELDNNLDFIDANINGVTVIGQTVSVDLGTVDSGKSGNFKVTVNVNCDNTDLGETLCAKAEISADDSMIPPSNWSGAVLMTEIDCEGDSVVINITNIGMNDVLLPLNFIVIEDDVMLHSNETDPTESEQRSFKYEDQGGVYRVVADQPIGYPYGTFETDFVQPCDDDNAGSYEFVSMFPNADVAPVVDIECHEVIGSYDPNDILAYPAGYRSEHRIDANQDIEYTIRFQNTGTDTAFNITIENLIDPSLDIESLIAGSASHDYVLTILENGSLSFDFYNILLPQSAVNTSESNGFVSYKISQKVDLPLGTQISNTADIFFDFNDAIVTNTYTHLIGEEYIEIILDDKTILLDYELVAAPNPAVDIMRVEVPETTKDVSYILYDINGMIVNAANCPSNVFYINKGMMFRGIYILEIKSEERTIGRKKLMFN
ncbi:MAG: putative repeat protein (TIGR01451 family) [Saprospiraceae bacterium]|jgi:uncharacterized repeat protein (TIGR01451 family)